MGRPRPAPLVSPGAPLTRERLTRFSRQLLLPGFGETAQRRLANARVLVVGAGGLGSASIPYLAAVGVGTVGIVDSDVVELSNLHRQVTHRLQDVGMSKVDSIAESVFAIDPAIVVNRHHLQLDSSNAPGILAEYDLVVDGSDNFPTRYLTNDAAALLHKPLVWGAISRFDGQAGVAWVNHGPTYRDLFPVSPHPGDILNCADGGVLPSVCAAIGAIMSTETVKLITGIGDPLIGRITTYDALTGRYRELHYDISPHAQPITHLVGDDDLVCQAATLEATTDNPATDSELPMTDVIELSRRLTAETPMQLIDVREQFEADIVRIGGSQLIPIGDIEQSLHLIRTDVPVVVYCHHGGRSQRVMEILQRHGFSNIENLHGGVDAYATHVDTTLARY